MKQPDNDANLKSSDHLFAGGNEMATLMRQKDWSATPLGPPETWPQSLRTIVRVILTSRFAMWMGWGPELTFFYNDAYAAMTLGAKHPWALGRPSREVWPEIWSEIGPRIDKVIATGEATWDESLQLYLERNGYPEETYHTFSYSPASDDDGVVQGHLCVVSEDTERVIAERRLQVLKELASQLAATNEVRDVFGGSERCLRVDSRDLPFTLIYTFEGDTAHLSSSTNVPPGDALAPQSIDIDTLGQLWSLEIPRQYKWVEVAAAHVPAEWGSSSKQILQIFVMPIMQQGQDQPVGVLIAGVNPFRRADESYRTFVSLYVGQIAAGLANARAYEATRQRADALAEIDRAKTLFFTNISHEFRTPLTLILGPIEDLLSDSEDLKTEHSERVVIAHRNATRLLKLVNSLLDFTRLEAGRVKARYEPTNLGKFTEELASAFSSLVEKSGLSLEVNVEQIDGEVYVDREMWEKIVLNLISNAFKFTFQGRITVSLRPDGDLVRLEVADTGAGIAESELPYIFDRFHRVEGVRSRSYEGTGIGLALVQELAKMHGGSVQVASRVDEGSRFTVTLPRGREHLPKDMVVATGSQPSNVTGAALYLEEARRWSGDESDSAHATTHEPFAVDGTSPPAEPDRRAQVLVVDDNPDMRDYLCRLLEPYYNVATSVDGALGLKAARAKQPQLILADVMMPNTDGFGLLRELRNDPLTATIPIILLSARSGEESRVEGLNLGADDYLVKPFSARELLARVRSHIELHRMRTQLTGEKEALLAREQEARHEAELASRSKDEFIAMLGHELRNPLSPILTALQLMQLRNGGPIERERQVIERQVRHLARLVDDLLDVSRIARGNVQLKKQHVEVAEIVARAIEIASPLMEQRMHYLTVSVPTTGLTIDADPTRLAQIISNLLTNAAKYTDPKGHIDIIAERVGAEIVLRVRDNGVGIDAKLIPHLFDLFYQGARQFERSQGGLGIGLTIVKNLVDLHGGSVSAFSEGLGKGSEFTIRLPASRPAQVGGSAAAGIHQYPVASTLSGLRVFIVDDNEDAAELLAIGLSQKGHVTATAFDPVSALAEVGRFSPDVMLIDIGLPVMDGHELANRLREMPELGSARLFALSGYGQQSDREKALKSGFQHHLTKPVDLDELDTLIRAAKSDAPTSSRP